MPLIELKHIDKSYKVGDLELAVLKNVSLNIEAGEYVALTGASGSGKTSLMNLLGCLDRPSKGSFTFGGTDVRHLSNLQLGQFRSSRIGFVFQSFNLLPRVTALENVCMPSAYSTVKRTQSCIRQQARALLTMVGLEKRMHHSPAKLSGGEQQRVAIARSLINHPTVLLADEPTGNLDSQTGLEILQLFRRLNLEQGITIVLVTHDAAVANNADRIIRISDGRIAEDSRTGYRVASEATPYVFTTPARRQRARHDLVIAWGAMRIAVQALGRNLMRTMLTMLGVIIGVAAVIAMMEISYGASAAITVTVTKMGANTLAILPGGPQRGEAKIRDKNSIVTPDDAEAIRRECPDVVCAAPVVEAWGQQVVFGNKSWSPEIVIGSTSQFLNARNWNDLELGREFTDREIRSASKVCLIGKTVVRELFKTQNPIGAEIRVKNVPFTVIGVLKEKGANLLGTDQDDLLVAPWTTVKYRVSGANSDGADGPLIPIRALPGRSLSERLPGIQHAMRAESLDQILVKVSSTDAIARVIDEITLLLRDRHHLSGNEADFQIYDNAEVSNILKKTVTMLSGLGMSIALISLIVGGVGIMNIMLVSVTERTREIGLRMAVGADARDILRQFLIEAVALCLMGGVIGILAGRGGSLLAGKILDWPTQASPAAAAISVAVSVIVGVTFGYYPAWRASRLNPIDALRYE
ncbi:MAG: ABC transporter permease [Planctomycetales bacterium]|jgi:macrolide transport system ATP-binding/permease protein|nr:ABC transporter permease [Planctomycetales bacterium]